MREILGLPMDVSTHGPVIDNMIVIIHWLMLVLFVGWGIYFLYTLFRFRKKRNPKANPEGVKNHFSTYVEIGVAVFEGFLLVGLAIPVWSNVVTDFPSGKDVVNVRVVAEQFAWNIHYPGADGVFGRRDIHLVTSENPLGLDRTDPAAKDDITTINVLHLPINKPVLIQLSSKDVIHSFGIPLLRVKQDAIPGHNVPIKFIATTTSADISKQLDRVYRIAPGHIPVQLTNLSAKAEYVDKDGNSILAVGETITRDAIDAALSAGITEIRAGSDNPVEIACAQLCGLGHYRMRGAVTLETEAEFNAWLAEEASYLDY